MDTQQTIQAWFNQGQPYDAGVALATAAGASAAQLRLLATGRNSVTQAKLRQLLQARLEQLASDSTAPPAPRPATPAAAVAADPTPATAAVATEPAPRPVPPELAALRVRRLATFKQAQHHFGQMRATPEGPQRGEHALAVKRLMRENARLWSNERYFEQFGFLPPTDPVPAGLDLRDRAAVTRRRNTLRTYASDYERGKRGTPEKYAAWKAELLELDLVLTHA